MIRKERHVLIVLPHPDDEAFGFSGTAAHHIQNGTPVTYVCLTLGQMGRMMGNPLFANRETLPLIRERELEASCRSIGITDLRKFGLRDKTVEFEDPEALADRILDVVRETDPSLIMTFHPELSVHPDHNATGAAVIRAVARLPEPERPDIYCLGFANQVEQVLGPPDIVHDVSAFAKQKIGSLFAHQSQIQFIHNRFEGKDPAEDPEQLKKISTERFWTYRWEWNSPS
ncbi:bacillithiol biosynthesis deacetylase BshB2 [Ferviditalea candida]|uniref:Bacillithiol biosynthesis deacetylase BshB2 n=1 Tax=Ferviditalea candida TaxID=3108399 RepID=A0ABU5ZI86_9BACL|nr:bacillithiol biosynthesis deacetylase BshB2 [Paenibacillaceae bacterium T2]